MEFHYEIIYFYLFIIFPRTNLVRHFRKERNSFIFYNFTLTFFNLKESNEGSYSCFITERNENDEHTFQIYVKPSKLLNSRLSIGLSFCLFSIIICLYILRYDVKIFMKYCLRISLHLDRPVGNYNFFFIYDFNNEQEFKTVCRVVTKIESSGFKCYFHHRDKIYGKNVLEDLVTNLMKSDVIVCWVSHDLWKNSACIYCIQMLIKMFPNKKRLYVLTESKVSAMELCDSKVVLMDTKSSISSKYIRWSPTNINSKSFEPVKMWNWHYMLSWLLSSLPVNYKNNQVFSFVPISKMSCK